MSGRTAVCLHTVEEQRVRSARFFRLKALLFTPGSAVRISWSFYIEQVGTGSNRSRCRTERCFFLLSVSVPLCWTGLIGVCVWEGLPRLSLFCPHAFKDASRERTCMRAPAPYRGVFFLFSLASGGCGGIQLCVG